MASTPQVILDNERLKQEFKLRNLPLKKVWEPIPHDLEIENRQLNNLLNWVDHYVLFGGKEAMINAGYMFPPVQPGLDPESDWKQFERWISKRASNKSFSEIHKVEHSFPPEWLMDDEMVDQMLAALVGELAEREVGFEAGELPTRKAYECLRLFLRNNNLEDLEAGTVMSFG